MAGGPRLDPERHAAFQIVALANRISASASRVYLRRFGVGVMEWRVLALVAMRPGLTAAEISQISAVDKSPVSRAVQALIGRGLMQPRGDAADSRRIRLTLTPAGETLHDAMIAASLERDARLLLGLSASGRRRLFQLLSRLSANLAAVEREEATQAATVERGALRAKRSR